MLGESSARSESHAASYWLIVKGGARRTEALTVVLGEGRRTLPVFSFPDEAGLFLSLGGFAPEEGWRVARSTSGELLSALAEDLPEVGYVALDPLPEMVHIMCGTTISLVTLSRQKFINHLAARWNSTATN